MRKSILVSALAAGVVVPAAAAALALHPGSLAGNQPQTRQLTEQAQPLRKAAITNAATPKQRPQLRVSTPQRVSSFADYGTLTEILYEDFSLMSSGSIAQPDIKTQMWISRKQAEDEGWGDDYSPWRNMLDGYTQKPGWGTENAYPAGGSLFFFASENRGQAHINTCLVDGSMGEGVCVLEFKTRAMDGETNAGLLIEGAETRNMGPTWDILGTAVAPEAGSEWITVQAMFQHCGPTTIFNICQMLPQQCYIDDLRVYTLDQYVRTPVLKAHTDYTDQSFTANWQPVEGAEKYLVNVYTETVTGNPMEGESVERTYLYNDLEATTNSLSINTSGDKHAGTYYYTVRAVKGTHTSIESLPQMVFDIVAPTGLASTVHDDGMTYDAQWNQVLNAERYNYWAYNERVAEQDGEFVVSYENFDGICFPGTDVSTGWTILFPDPDNGTFDDFYPDSGLDQAGWHAESGAPYEDFICVDAYHYIYNNKMAGLESPEMDLSKDGGKAHLSVSLAGELIPESMLDPKTGEIVDAQVECAVAVFNWNDELRDYEQTSIAYAKDANGKGVEGFWKDFDFDLTGLGERCIVGIFGVNAPGNLYIDNVKLTQNYQKGQSLNEPFVYAHWFDPTQGGTVELAEGDPVKVTIGMDPKVRHQKVTHKVSAVRGRTEGQGMFASAVRIESPFTELLLVREPLGVQSLNFDKEGFEVSITPDGLVSVSAGTMTVYDLKGQTLCQGQASFQLAERGVYLVKSAGKTVKVMF